MGTRTHKHKCVKCGFVWEHADASAAPAGRNFYNAHTCVCGHIETGIYKGDDAPSYVGCEQPVRMVPNLEMSALEGK